MKISFVIAVPRRKIWTSSRHTAILLSAAMLWAGSKAVNLST